MSKEELRIVQERRRRVYVTKGWRSLRLRERESTREDRSNGRVYSRDRCVSGDREKRRSKARAKGGGMERAVGW